MKAIVTCALTGVLTNPRQHPVPVTPEEMADAARQAFDAGASIIHFHARDVESGALLHPGTEVYRRIRGMEPDEEFISDWQHPIGVIVGEEFVNFVD